MKDHTSRLVMVLLVVSCSSQPTSSEDPGEDDGGQCPSITPFSCQAPDEMLEFRTVSKCQDSTNEVLEASCAQAMVANEVEALSAAASVSPNRLFVDLRESEEQTWSIPPGCLALFGDCAGFETWLRSAGYENVVCGESPPPASARHHAQ